MNIGPVFEEEFASAVPLWCTSMPYNRQHHGIHQRRCLQLRGHSSFSAAISRYCRRPLLQHLMLALINTPISISVTAALKKCSIGVGIPCSISA
jgi:hypothetical protein